MLTVTAQVQHDGRITISKQAREDLSLEQGDFVVLSVRRLDEVVASAEE